MRQKNLPTSKNSPTFLLFTTAPEVTPYLTRGWTKNNGEWILQIGVLDKMTVNCYHGSRERLMVKGVDQGLLLGVFRSRTNLAQWPHRGDMVHTGSNWSYPLLGSTLPLLAMQPLGITATEKQARWLVSKEDTERQPCFSERIFNNGTKNIWKEIVWISKRGAHSIKMVLYPLNNEQSWCGPFHQQFLWTKW